MPHEPSNGILEEFRIEFLDCWNRLPNKGFFLILFAAWLALFQFLGNSVRGYIDTPSLLNWMWSVYTAKTPDGEREDAHGMLIPFVVLGLLWWKRKELLAAELRLWWPGLGLVAFGLFLHVAGFVGQQSRISIIGLFTGLYGLMGLAWGPAWLRRTLLPFFLFAFSVPLGPLAQPVTFRLQMLASRLVELISNGILGIGIVRVGTQLMDATGHDYQYGVAAACSGIHSLVATVVIALIYALICFRTWWRGVVMVLVSLPLAVAGNVMRLMAVIVAAEIGGQELGKKVHDGGWMGIWSLLPYVPVFAGVLLLGHWLREPQPAAEVAKEPAAVEKGA